MRMEQLEVIGERFIRRGCRGYRGEVLRLEMGTQQGNGMGNMGNGGV